MGDINFVNNPDKKPGNNKKREEPVPVKWTQPDGAEKEGGEKEEGTNTKAVDGLKHEDTSVSSIIEKEERPNIKPEKKFGFGEFFVGLFKKKENNNSSVFKDEKKKIAEHKEEVNKEKKERGKLAKDNIVDKSEKNTKENVPDNRIKYSEANKLSISDAIKMKLKLDSLGKGGSNTIKTNLIKNEITTYIDWKKKVTDLTLNIVVSIIIVGIAYGALMYREHRAILQEAGIDKQIANLNEQIEVAIEDVAEIDKFQKKIALVAGILNEHIYWTNFFAFLEKTILDEVTYAGSFSGSPTGTYGFSVTADSFQTAENQVRVLRNNKLVRSANVSSVSFNASSEDTGINIPTANFSITFEIDPKLFNMDKEEFNSYFEN